MRAEVTCECIKCESKMDNVAERGFQPMGGTAFSTRGHYGSTVFDPMDGTALEIVICDKCLGVAVKTPRVFHWNTPDRGGLGMRRREFLAGVAAVPIVTGLALKKSTDRIRTADYTNSGDGSGGLYARGDMMDSKNPWGWVYDGSNWLPVPWID